MHNDQFFHSNVPCTEKNKIEIVRSMFVGIAIIHNLECFYGQLRVKEKIPRKKSQHDWCKFIDESRSCQCKKEE